MTLCDPLNDEVLSMNIFKCINEYSEKYKHKVALSDGDRNISFSELQHLIWHNVEVLRREGYCSGNNIILKNDGQLEYIVMFLSLLALECWVIPISNEVTESELENIQIQTDGIIVDNYPIKNIVSSVKHELIVDEEKCGILHMTSGSTGIPKFCVRTLKALEYEGESYIITFTLKEQDIVLSGAPLHHSYALGGAIFPALMSGASLYTINKFTPRQVLRMIEQFRVTYILLVPIMAKMLCDVYSLRKIDTASLRVALVGAGSINGELFEKFYSIYNIYLMSNYGSTETGALVSRLDSVHYNSIGKVMNDILIRVCDEEGKEVPNGEIGEIFVKSKGMFERYYKTIETPFDGNGFFPMGDLGIRDEEGNFYLKGRKKLLINVGGKKVNPIEVEKAILEIDGVKDCAVVGVKRGDNEIIKAYIVSDFLTKKDVLQSCKDKMSSHKVPNIIEFVDQIPKNVMGKININLLTNKKK